MELKENILQEPQAIIESSKAGFCIVWAIVNSS